MFNPDMMKMAMEQMNRMTPEQACARYPPSACAANGESLSITSKHAKRCFLCVLQMRQMQQMAANMDPTQMAQMQQMAANMDPAQMRQMQQQVGIWTQHKCTACHHTNSRVHEWFPLDAGQ